MTREQVIALVCDARVWIGKGDNDRVAIGPVADGRALRAELVRLLRLPPLPATWEWRPGMVVIPPSHLTERWLLCWVEGDKAGAYSLTGGKTWGLHDDEPLDLSEGWAPDLSDPGTIGIMQNLDILS